MPVWGTAAPGEHVTVDFAGQKKDAAADAAGHWRVILDPLQASNAAAEMAVIGRNTIKIASVLVGEVWLCSGQSNMEKPLGDQRGQQPTFNYEQEVRAANYPGIRLLVVPRARQASPAVDADVSWTPCSPESVVSTHFSAVAYFFGRKLFQELKVPIGLIDSSFGGSLDGGLMSKDGKPLSWFTVAGKDGKFVPATATIEGTQVAVSSPEVAAPTAVRFGWDELAMPNLCNKAGLPASPFRTDFVPWHAPGH